MTTTPKWHQHPHHPDTWETMPGEDPEQEASMEVQEDGSVQVICWWGSDFNGDAVGTAIPLRALENIVAYARRTRAMHLKLGTTRCK